MAAKGKGRRARPCFVISPIGPENSKIREDANKVLKKIIEPVLTNKGFKATRIDQRAKPGPITDEIIDRLHSDDLCVAVLTGLNPNVMYEVGLRHAWDLPLVCLAEKGTILPFDVKDHFAIFYSMAEPSPTDGGPVARVRVRRAIMAARGALAEAVGSIEDVLKSAGNKVARLNSTLGAAMQKCSRRYALDVLFHEKRETLRFLQRQLRGFAKDMRRADHLQVVTKDVATEFGDEIIGEFDGLATTVLLLENIVGGFQSQAPNHDGCLGVLERMKELQAGGAAVGTCLIRFKQPSDFPAAIAKIDELIETIDEILKQHE